MSRRQNNISPVGSSVSEDIAEDLRNPAYREAHDELAAFEKLARLVIVRRAELGITQAELASRIGTTASSISRIESGQRKTSPDMMRKLAEALGGHAVMGFDFGTADEPRPELVTL
jgi:ribosome-binding protein aMBF1 (putative translation factor)